MSHETGLLPMSALLAKASMAGRESGNAPPGSPGDSR